MNALWAIALLLGAALVGMAGVAILNVFTFPRLTDSKQAGRPPDDADDAGDAPLVSLLVPARNEAAIIGATVAALLAQTYRQSEVIVLDDHSTDETQAAARAAGAGDPRLRVITGAALPDGWLGKHWACQQLADAARGEWLVFVDADTRWQPGALAALIAQTHARQPYPFGRGHKSDTPAMLTVWSTQIVETWSERLVVPLIGLVICAYLPVLGVHYTPFPALAAANGQCIAIRRSAYQQVGGHAAVRSAIVEDIVLARRVKAAGLRLRMIDGAGVIACRMYQSWREVRDGFAKNILAGYGGSVPALLLATAFHLLVFVVPPLWLAVALAAPHIIPAGSPGAREALALTALGVGVRALTAAATRQRVHDALAMPLSALLMTRIAAQALWWQWRYGGVVWKGRVIAAAKGAL